MTQEKKKKKEKKSRTIDQKARGLGKDNNSEQGSRH